MTSCHLEFYKSISKTTFFVERWTPPSGWSGPTPILYRSFDSPPGITLREGSGGQGGPTLVSGKVKCTLIKEVKNIHHH